MKNQRQRFHGFDALRSVMLLLGVFLHVSLSYFPDVGGLRQPDVWYYYDASQSWLAPAFYAPVHLYRLPIFFVLAGFFAALLVSRRSLKGMLINRFQRLGLPLAIAAPLLIPTMYSSAKFAWAQRGSTSLPQGGHENLWQLMGNDLHYLWFLWQLLLLCVATALVGRIIQISSQRVQHAVAKIGTALVCSPAGIAALLAATTGLNMLMRPWPGFVETSTTLLPSVHVLLSYGVFFVYGLALYANQDMLRTMTEQCLRCLTVGLIGLVIYSVLLIAGVQQQVESTWLTLLMSGLSALSTWSMTWGCMGAALRFFNQPNAVMRYVSDSSYWIYLAHMPLVFLTQGWLAPLELPGTVKLLLSAAMTITMCVASYQLLVRDTPIGTLLNGRRHTAAPAPKLQPAQHV